MGILGDQAIRLLRDDWGGGGTKQLAEELFTIFTADVPVKVDSPLEITIKGQRIDQPPLSIFNYTPSPTSLAINNGAVVIGDQNINIHKDSFGDTTTTFGDDTIGGVTTHLADDVRGTDTFGSIIPSTTDTGQFTINDGLTLGGGSLKITNQGDKLPTDKKLNSTGTGDTSAGCCHGSSLGGDTSGGSGPCKDLDIVLSFCLCADTSEGGQLHDLNAYFAHVRRFLDYKNIPDTWRWWVVFYGDYNDLYLSVDPDDDRILVSDHIGRNTGQEAESGTPSSSALPGFNFPLLPAPSTQHIEFQETVLVGPTGDVSQVKSFLANAPPYISTQQARNGGGDFYNAVMDVIERIAFRQGTRRAWFDFADGYTYEEMPLAFLGDLPGSGYAPASRVVVAMKQKGIALYQIPDTRFSFDPPAQAQNMANQASFVAQTGGKLYYWNETATNAEAAFMLRNNLVCSGKTRVFRGGEFTGG